MTKYEVVNKTYVKSNNKSSTILSRYTYTLIAFTILSLIINLIIGNDIIPVIKNIFISLVVTCLLTYIINLIKRKNNFKSILIEDDAIAIGLILGIFQCSNIIVLLISIIITLIIKNICKNMNLSAAIYGILIIALYNNYIAKDVITPLIYLKNISNSIDFKEIIDYGGGILNYLFGISYLSPLLSVFVFIYLFYKKGIKYNIVIYYILTIALIFTSYGFAKGIPWLIFIELFSDSLIFLTIYILTDYKNSPTIEEAGMLYGIILGIITAILRFIIPNLAVIITIIIGSLVLTKILEKNSYKLKYHPKTYKISVIASIILVIITTIVLVIIN